MRYYDILITDPVGGAPPIHISSLNDDGSTNPNARSIDLDIPVGPMHSPQSGAYVRIWGVAISDISQSQQLNDRHIVVSGGMAKGLPLAVPSQRGVLVEGKIYQAFGNWLGTQQSLDIVIYPDVGTYDKPTQILFNWKAGQQLSDAVTASIGLAFPGASVTNSGICPSLAISQNQIGVFGSLRQLAEYVQKKSSAMAPPTTSGASYSGLQICSSGSGFRLIDNYGSASNPVNLLFTDLIGQPTWIDLVTIQISTVMRGDISVGDYLMMPPSQLTTSPASGSRFRQQSIFSGLVQVIGKGLIRHVGSFRQPDAMSWITTINAVVQNV